MPYNELLARYVAGPQQLRKAVAGMTAEQVRARPIAGRWSTLEVVAHIADFEIIGVDRLIAVLAEDDPSMPGRDEQKFAGRLNYHDRNLDEQLQLIEICRRHAAAHFRKLEEQDWRRRGIHSEVGPLTLLQLLERVTGHIEHHLPFIDEKRRALAV